MKSSAINAKLGQVIADARLSAHWSLDRFASELGLSEKAIRDIEAGLTSPSFSLLFQIALVLDTPPRLLYGGIMSEHEPIARLVHESDRVFPLYDETLNRKRRQTAH